jgi:beta-hydroxyacyl-ACP dehydratase FabZ
MTMMDIHKILKQLPHRYPILLVDRVLELEKGVRIKALKNVSINEPHFQGHFPHRPVMPGVLQMEAMAQVAGILVLKEIPDRHQKLVLLASVDGAKFRRPVRPGDQLRIEMKMISKKATICKMSGEVTVDGVIVAEATLMCVIRDRVIA